MEGVHMSDYYTREHEKYRKEQNEGSLVYLLVSLGMLTAFVPVALLTVGSMKAYKRIKGVFTK